MKQTKYLFLDIASSIFLLILFISNFMGLLFILDGNVGLSLLASTFITICYFFTVILLKKNKEMMIKNKLIHFSTFFWLFFIALFVISSYLMSHFINIQYNCKDKIQKDALSKIQAVRDLKDSFVNRSSNDLLNYDVLLKTKLNSYVNNPNLALKRNLIDSFHLDSTIFNTSFISPSAIVSGKLKIYEIIDSNAIKNIDSTIVLNCDNYQAIFDNWKILKLVNAYNSLNDFYLNSLTYVNKKLSALPLDTSSIENQLLTNPLPLNNPSKLNKLYPSNSLVPNLFVLFMNLFILIPFIFEKVRKYNASVPNTNVHKGKGIEY